MILGLAVSKYKAKLVKEQELLMRIADLIIETYICESALLKTEKIIQKYGVNNCETQIKMTINYIQSSLHIARVAAEEVIMSTTNGIKNKFLISISKKLTKQLSYDMKEVRRSIADQLQKDGKYKFSI